MTIHGHMPPAADIETILADPGGACPGCVRIVIEGFRAEVERLRALRAKDLQWEARLAERVLSGQDATNDLAEQIRRAWMVAAEMHEFNSPDGDHLEGCPGCRVEAALGGTEAGQ